MNPLVTFTRYRTWADRLVYDAVARMPREAVERPQPIVFGSLLRTLNHVLLMDRVWQAHLLGESHDITSRNPDTCPALDSLRGEQEAMNAWYERYAASLSPADLAEVVSFRFIGGSPGAMTREDIILHVVNHATYHRGHIADMMYHASVQPPTTDLPVFIQAQGE